MSYCCCTPQIYCRYCQKTEKPFGAVKPFFKLSDKDNEKFMRDSTHPPVTESHKRKPLTDEQLDKAGMKLAECMDYPWEHMPEEGKQNMRDHAKAIIEAAHGIKE